MDDSYVQGNYNPQSQLGAVQKFVHVGIAEHDYQSQQDNNMRITLNYPLVDISGSALIGSKGNGWIQANTTGIRAINWTGVHGRLTTPKTGIDADSGVIMDYYWTLVFDCRGRV